MHPTIQQIIDTQLLPLYYHDDYERCLQNILACYDAGVKVFEFTNRGTFAAAHFGRLKADLSATCADLKLGVGTIYTAEEAKVFAELGADFIVQPVCTLDVCNYCQTNQLPWIPGVMTLNEIYQAIKMGAELVKIFPASFVGQDYIRNIRGPLPHANLMVTGGIDAEAEVIASWLKSGVKVCGLGSQLFADPQGLGPSGITQKLSNILNAIQHD